MIGLPVGLITVLVKSFVTCPVFPPSKLLIQQLHTAFLRQPHR